VLLSKNNRCLNSLNLPTDCNCKAVVTYSVVVADRIRDLISLGGRDGCKISEVCVTKMILFVVSS